MALPIYTHIPNLKVPTKIFFKLSRPKGNLCGGGVTVLNPKYPRLSSGDTTRTNNKPVISTFKYGYCHLTSNEGSKVKSDHIRRFSAHNFLQIGFTSQTSRTNNKQVISTFIFGYPHLTLKERPKVNSDHIRRFPAHDFLKVGFTSQTSRINKL